MLLHALTLHVLLHESCFKNYLSILPPLYKLIYFGFDFNAFALFCLDVDLIKIQDNNHYNHYFYPIISFYSSMCSCQGTKFQIRNPYKKQ